MLIFHSVKVKRYTKIKLRLLRCLTYTCNFTLEFLRAGSSNLAITYLLCSRKTSALKVVEWTLLLLLLGNVVKYEI